MSIRITRELGVVTGVFQPSILEAELGVVTGVFHPSSPRGRGRHGFLAFQASLVYPGSSRSGKATQRNFVYNNNQQQEANTAGKNTGERVSGRAEESSLPMSMVVPLTREIIRRTGGRTVKLFWFITSYHSSQPDEPFSLGFFHTPTDRLIGVSKLLRRETQDLVLMTSEWVYCQA